MNRRSLANRARSLFAFARSTGAPSASPSARPRDARLDLAMKTALEPLEQRVLMAVDTDLQPSQLTAVQNGLKGLSNWADTVDNFGDFARQLPLVGRSIGQALDLGNTLRSTLLTPIEGLTNLSPAEIAQTIMAQVPGSVVTPVVENNEIRFDVTFNRAKTENRPLDFGTNSESINADASFNAALATNLAGNLSFGFDLTRG